MISLTPRPYRAPQASAGRLFPYAGEKRGFRILSMPSEFGWVIGIKVWRPNGTARWTR
jgi:hypothetical protein